MAVNVRHIVDDLDSAIAFYTGSLGFAVERHPGPGFAMLVRGELRLLLNSATGSGGAARAMPATRSSCSSPGASEIRPLQHARRVRARGFGGARRRSDLFMTTGVSIGF
jgi:catechol 2,3-dioxygenase-like lactoylglutathione lyase family enzyme